MSHFSPSVLGSVFVRGVNSSSRMTREQLCSFALINTVASAAIAYDRSPMVLCGAVGAMIGSTRAVCSKIWNKDKGYASIFWEALLGAGLSAGIAGLATQSWKRAPLPDQIDCLVESAQERLRGVFREGFTLR